MGGAGASRARRDELVAWLDEHTDYERSMPTRLKAPTLERMVELCHVLGNPERACPVIHLTGTNGKGSTARILTALLMAQGLTVGTYSSPNLSRLNERLARDAEPVSDEELAEVLDALRLVEPVLSVPPSRFELLTAAAFRFFADSPVDVAVVEVGLGGRWDATNVVEPDVVAVTNVSYDHVEVLGPTLSDIASEKAGIVKPGAQLLVGETAPDLARIFLTAGEAAGVRGAWTRGAQFQVEANRLAVGGRLVDLRTPGAAYEELYLPLHGAHQGDNASLALACAEAFFGTALDDEVVRDGLATVTMPGRFEVVGRAPLVVLDGAHNAAGAQALADTLQEIHPVADHPDGWVAVVGLLHGRDPSAILDIMRAGGVQSVVACTAPSPRALPATVIAEAARALGMTAQATDATGDALALARSQVEPDGALVVTGSLYVVAEAREALVGATPPHDAGSLTGP